MKKIIIYEFQDLRFASRARKEAFTLSKLYSVELVGYNATIKKKKITIVNEKLIILEYPIIFKYNKNFVQKLLNIMWINICIGRYLFLNYADVYIMHNLKIFYPSLFMMIFFKKAIIYDAHELHMAQRPNTSLRNYLLTKYDILKGWVLTKYASRILQASEERASYFSNFYNTKKPLVIENHANLQNYNIPYDVSLRKDYGLLDEKIVIFTGNITIGGNQLIENVIKSLKYVSSDIHLCLLGSISKKVRELIHLILKDNDLIYRVHILDPVLSEKVVDYIRDADVAIIPIYADSINSRYSALNKISQSLMAGLPIASSNYENLEILITKNSFGCVGKTFDVEKPKSIANAIEHCLVNKEEFSKNAKLLSKNQINWEKQEDKLFECINQILII